MAADEGDAMASSIGAASRGDLAKHHAAITTR
jgi:hypothetical protein